MKLRRSALIAGASLGLRNPKIPPGLKVFAALILPSLCPRPAADDIPKSSTGSSLQWVTKWVDYSNKYGFGYQLSDHTVGVLFNKGTHMSLLPDRKYAPISAFTTSLALNPISHHTQWMAACLSMREYVEVL